MAETLYRKYRPQRFADIQGQESITTTLTNQITRDRIAHAYLFSGTRGTGKTTTARVFAKAINCRQRGTDSAEPCGECSSCTDITAGRSVDVIELDAATHTGVDTVREEIIENARFLPTRDRYKIFIIDEVHMLSTSSFNALLKSLEEPPAHVVYILATTELHKVPATVASRCQRFIFHPLALSVMETKLLSIAEREHVVVDSEVIHRILATSGGAMRDAESLLGQLFAIGLSHITTADADVVLPPTLFEETIAFISTIEKNDTAGAFHTLQQLFENGVDLTSFHDALMRRAHELLVIRSAGSIPLYLGIFSESERTALTTMAGRVATPLLNKLLEVLIEKRPLYRTINSPFIPLHLTITALLGDAYVPPQTPPRPPQAVTPPTPVSVTAPAPIQPSPEPVQQPPAPASAPIPSPITPSATPSEPLTAATTLDHNHTPSDDFDMPMVSLEEGAPTPESSPAPLDLQQQISKFWPIATQAIIMEQPSLGIILAGTHIANIAGPTIMLATKFPMYREKLMEIKVKNRIETRLSELCGTTITYSVTYIPDSETHAPEVTDILDTFGGRVVG